MSKKKISTKKREYSEKSNHHQIWRKKLFVFLISLSLSRNPKRSYDFSSYRNSSKIQILPSDLKSVLFRRASPSRDSATITQRGRSIVGRETAIIYYLIN